MYEIYHITLIALSHYLTLW